MVFAALLERPTHALCGDNMTYTYRIAPHNAIVIERKEWTA